MFLGSSWHYKNLPLKTIAALLRLLSRKVITMFGYTSSSLCVSNISCVMMCSNLLIDRLIKVLYFYVRSVITKNPWLKCHECVSIIIIIIIIIIVIIECNRRVSVWEIESRDYESTVFFDLFSDSVEIQCWNQECAVSKLSRSRFVLRKRIDWKVHSGGKITQVKPDTLDIKVTRMSYHLLIESQCKRHTLSTAFLGLISHMSVEISHQVCIKSWMVNLSHHHGLQQNEGKEEEWWHKTLICWWLLRKVLLFSSRSRREYVGIDCVIGIESLSRWHDDYFKNVCCVFIWKNLKSLKILWRCREKCSSSSCLFLSHWFWRWIKST